MYRLQGLYVNTLIVRISLQGCLIQALNANNSRGKYTSLSMMQVTTVQTLIKTFKFVQKLCSVWETLCDITQRCLNMPL